MKLSSTKPQGEGTPPSQYESASPSSSLVSPSSSVRESEQIQILQKALFLTQLQGSLQFTILQNLINQMKNQYSGFNEQNTIHPGHTPLNAIPQIQDVQLNNESTSCIEDFNDDQDDQSQPRPDSQLLQQNALFPVAREIILFIIENLNIHEENIIAQRAVLEQDNPRLLDVFEILTKQFRGLQKTQQEMIQFVMRKAFKFLFSNLQNQTENQQNLKQANDTCMKHYFADMIDDSFVLPFRKNSQIQTMNTTFLKRIFSSKQFYYDYQAFLVHFDQLAQEDNQKQIDLLAYTISPLMEEKNLKQIENLRRLPWTDQLLETTRKLSISLLQFSDCHMELQPNSPIYPQKQLNQEITSLSTHFSSPLKNPSLQSPQSLKRKNIFVISPNNCGIKLQKDEDDEESFNQSSKQTCTDGAFKTVSSQNQQNFSFEPFQFQTYSASSPELFKAD